MPSCQLGSAGDRGPRFRGAQWTADRAFAWYYGLWTTLLWSTAGRGPLADGPFRPMGPWALWAVRTCSPLMQYNSVIEIVDNFTFKLL